MRTHFARLALVASLLAGGCAMPAGKPSQPTFDTPEAAVEAMFKAVSTDDTTALMALAGPDARDVVNSADRVQAKRERQVMTAAMIERWWLEGDGDTRTVVIGNESYPLAIPLIRENGKWRFDGAAGRDELFFRRIGRNELAVMDVAEAYVQAQKEYASRSHDGVPKGAFAQRIMSEENRHNGLFWPATASETSPSPMGELAAKAATQGYGREDVVKGAPYHGYYFKVLTEQGPNAPGGQRSWMKGDAMTGGFGLIAWPAEYGASGVMTFMIGPDGVLRQKDLGAETPALVQSTTAFDPDTSWKTP